MRIILWWSKKVLYIRKKWHKNFDLGPPSKQPSKISAFYSYVPGTSSELCRDHDPLLKPIIPKRYTSYELDTLN
jgi:hypothetical protein